MDKAKSLYTMRVFDEYEKKFAKIRSEKKLIIPTTDEDRKRIVNGVKKVLGFKDEWIPEIHNMQETDRNSRDGYDIILLQYETWDKFYSAATLFMPYGEGDVPLVFVFPGHSMRFGQSYSMLAERLVRLGFAVMIPDCVGHGCRLPYGHRDVIAPFYCGISVQGMILMESVALIRYMKSYPRIDKTRVGACGNSGGGTLTTFLAALGDDLDALCSCGYPSEFSYVHTKEKNHCNCNLLPGCANGPEMWEVLSAFAPKPLMIEQGEQDALFPDDMFMRVGRKVAHTYLQNGVRENFRAVHVRTPHAWLEPDRYHICNFFSEVFNMPYTEKDVETDDVLQFIKDWDKPFPEDALTTDQMAEKLTGIKMPVGTKFQDVFKPTFEGKPVNEELLMSDLTRGDIMKILAQMECALKKLD